MNTKGITFWEQHVEHLALGFAGVVFVGLAAMQFVGNPNAVEVNGKQVGPGEVDNMLREHAREISAMIAPGEKPPVDLPEPVPALTTFQTKLASGVSPKPTLWVSAPIINPGGKDAVDPAGGAFVQAEIAAPTKPILQQYIDTVEPEIVSSIAELQELLPAAPHDLEFVTVAAKFNRLDVRQEWQTDKDGARALPPSWIEEGGPYLVDIVVEREELVDENQFSNLTVMNVIPGRLTFRPQLASNIDSAVRDEVLGTLDEPASANEIVQPEFYPCLADAWSPPGAVQVVAETGNPEADELAKLKSQLKRLTLERDRLVEKMKESNCPEADPADAEKEEKDKERPSGGGRASGGGGEAPPGAGGGPSGASGGGRGLDRPQDGPDDSKCKELRNKLKKLKSRIEKLEQEIARLEPKDQAPVEEEKPKEVQSVMGDEVQIWAHDIWVEPGKTYRYRMTVKVYNPLFARKLDLIPEQQPLAEQFTLSSQTSEWSEPITVEPPLRVFVVDANPRANLAALGAMPFGHASTEVYRFFGGRWWSGKFNVRPGDRVGNADRSGKRNEAGSTAVDFGSSWFVLDVIEGSDSEGAIVLLQSMDSPMVTQYRSSKADAANPDRSWLRDAVAEANLTAPLAIK